MGFNLNIALPNFQIGHDLVFASLQIPQPITDRARITVALGNEVQAALDASFDLLKFLHVLTDGPITFLPETG